MGNIISAPTRRYVYNYLVIFNVENIAKIMIKIFLKYVFF